MTDTSAFDPIPAGGTGAERFDEPVLFYLTHQATIDEWHALRVDVAVALTVWFNSTVQDALISLADDRGLTVSMATGPPSGWDHLLIHPSTMPIEQATPVLGFGFAWHAKRVNPVTCKPYVCVRRGENDAGRNTAAVFLDSGGRDFRTSNKFKGGDTEVWPKWRLIEADKRWWTNLDAYRETIVAEVRNGLDGLGAALASAANVPSQGGPQTTVESTVP